MKKIILAAICIIFQQYATAMETAKKLHDTSYEFACHTATTADSEHLTLTRKDNVITALYTTTFGGKAAADWHMRATEQSLLDPDHTSAFLVAIPSMNTWNNINTSFVKSETTIVFQDASSMIICGKHDKETAEYTVEYTAKITDRADLEKIFAALLKREKNSSKDDASENLKNAFPELCTKSADATKLDLYGQRNLQENNK